MPAPYLIFTVPAVIFSPIGDEIFFRGLLQRALEEKPNVRTAALWVLLMSGVALLFARIRKRSGSLYPAMAAHAAFNAAMNAVILGCLWNQ